MMQTFTDHIATDLTEGDLANLGDRLELPEGGRFGSVVIDPLKKGQNQRVSMGFPEGLNWSADGDLDVKVETREPDGDLYVANGQLNQVLNSGAELRIRAVGFWLS